jgi:hypothetical protein
MRDVCRVDGQSDEEKDWGRNVVRKTELSTPSQFKHVKETRRLEMLTERSAVKEHSSPDFSELCKSRDNADGYDAKQRLRKPLGRPFEVLVIGVCDIYRLGLDRSPENVVVNCVQVLLLSSVLPRGSSTAKADLSSAQSMHQEAN